MGFPIDHLQPAGLPSAVASCPPAEVPVSAAHSCHHFRKEVDLREPGANHQTPIHQPHSGAWPAQRQRVESRSLRLRIPQREAARLGESPRRLAPRDWDQREKKSSFGGIGFPAIIIDHQRTTPEKTLLFGNNFGGDRDRRESCLDRWGRGGRGSFRIRCCGGRGVARG